MSRRAVRRRVQRGLRCFVCGVHADRDLSAVLGEAVCRSCIRTKRECARCGKPLHHRTALTAYDRYCAECDPIACPPAPVARLLGDVPNLDLAECSCPDPSCLGRLQDAHPMGIWSCAWGCGRYWSALDRLPRGYAYGP